MKKLLVGFLALGSISVLAQNTSGFERGFNEGKQTCLDSLEKEFWECSVKCSDNEMHTRTSDSRAQALEDLSSVYYTSDWTNRICFNAVVKDKKAKCYKL